MPETLPSPHQRTARYYSFGQPMAKSAAYGTGSLWPQAAGEIWQRRFYDFKVWTERKHIEKLRYMHRNLVKREGPTFGGLREECPAPTLSHPTRKGRAPSKVGWAERVGRPPFVQHGESCRGSSWFNVGFTFTICLVPLLKLGIRISHEDFC
jgi:hypothetical protein